MALFELDDGRIVEAQFGRELPGGLTPDILNAVRSQVLEIVSRPLFPVTWRDFSSVTSESDPPRLTALDASGQVVAVEVLDSLDAEILIDSLSSLADTASMSWTDLAREYPGNIEGFKMDWAHFRAAMPPSPPNGPRLILVVGTIHPEVRPALDVLSTSGVEVHEMDLRQMSNGRTFLDVSIVGPRIYGHRAELLVGDTGSLPAIAQGEVKNIAVPETVAPESVVREPRRAPVASASVRVPVQAEAVPIQAEAMPTKADAAAPTGGGAPAAEPARVTTPVPGRRVVAQRRQQPSAPLPSRMASRMARRRHADSAAPTAMLGRTEQGLAAIAAIVGRPTPLEVSPDQELTVDVHLSADGLINVGDDSFTDPTVALQAAGVSWMNGWEAWHLGDAYGPTLAEALEEVNRDAIRH